MRLRCFLWPNNLPHELGCKCSQRLTFHHLLNCRHFITYRSVLGVRDQLHAMCKSHKIKSFVELLLRKLAENEDDDSSSQRRADVIIPSSNGRLHVVEVVTFHVCKSTVHKFVLEKHQPLDNTEQGQRLKYEKHL
ncbi:hypothetical protein RCL1_004445 [Eukaryota sp. TZLM3-RCL]